MAAAIDYTKGASESVPDYNARIAAARTAAGGSGSGTPAAPDPTGAGSSNTDAFIKQLQATLLGQSGMVSSSDSSIEDTIQNAINGVNSANKSSDAAITSEADRNIGYQNDQNKTSETAFFEDRQGYATPTVAFANLREYNAKAIKDLDQRKNEAIMQGDATAAGKIADLQLQKLTFEQNAAQQTFSRLLQTGQFALSAQQNQDAEKAQTFQENQATAAIALQYGLKVDPGDSLQDVVNKAMPLASQEEKLKLQQVQSQIAANNATTAKALADAKQGASLDPASIAALAAAYRTPAGQAIVAASVKSPQTLSQIFAASANLETNDVTKYVQSKIDSGQSLEDTLSDLKTDPAITVQNYNGAAQVAANLYAKAPAKKTQNFGDSLNDFINTYIVANPGGKKPTPIPPKK